MTRWSNKILSTLLWTWGGCIYFLMEVVYKTLANHQNQISWTMLVLAIILCIPLERCGAELPWRCPIWIQALICAMMVTTTEFITGLILNIWLGLNIWDYSRLPGNLYGQICPQFTVLWVILCLIFIPVFDWLRYIVLGGERPHYYWKLPKLEDN